MKVKILYVYNYSDRKLHNYTILFLPVSLKYKDTEFDLSNLMLKHF